MERNRRIPRSPGLHWWPRTIRWQIVLGIVLLEALSIALFGLLLLRVQQRDIYERALQRLTHQATSVAAQARVGFRQNRPDWIGLSVAMMGESPSVERARITDIAGKTIFVSDGQPGNIPLAPEESTAMQSLRGEEARMLIVGRNHWEGVKPIYVDSVLRGYVWVESDRGWDTDQLRATLRAINIFGAVWIAASVLLVWFMGRTISKPLAVLHRGTRALIAQPDSTSAFPLPSTVDNELGDLIDAFNRMVASIEEQRAGLSDTLSLLDSMLANAPVGLAFFDRQFHFVRVNQIFADLTRVPLSRHLGRTPRETLPAGLAKELEEALRLVFASEQPVGDLEFRGQGKTGNRTWTWLVSAYPVRSLPQQIRWAGVIIRDVSERALAEESLRKTEKLAATGRLAASIAHEINNPLEALTNLLYLLRNYSELPPAALQYADMAEHETRRIAEIAQQTLRFYRQSTLPQRASLAELIDTALDLYKGRLRSMDAHVERNYDPQMSIFCYAGEIRQVFANLIANSLDAISAGGRLVVRARRGRHHRNPAVEGIRFTIADDGSGMEEETRARIFEAFFTTKETTGTGLGLWVSLEIILKHRGTVHVRSCTGGGGKPSGTVFQVFLPDDETLSVVRNTVS